LRPRFADPNLGTLFANTLPNSLDTTVYLHTTAPAEDTFIITGDIPAMWLRDSTNQVWPYLRLVKGDAALAALFRGLIHRQAANVLRAPYANAFQINGTKGSPNHGDSVFPKGANSNFTWEYKWESDSLSNVLRLASGYYNATGDLSAFDADWLAAVRLIFATFADQMRGSVEEDDGPGITYGFQRVTAEPSDSLEHSRGPPAQSGTGLIKCGFRGSDDALLLPFNIGENAFAASALTAISSLLNALGYAADAATATVMSNSIRAGIAAHGTFVHPITKATVYAYEIDGFGSHVFMDDANIPGLLSMPYYDFLASTDPLYLATRAALLSNLSNPYWITGTAGEGIGGPHNGWPFIWPMAISTRAWTSVDDDEIRAQLSMLLNSSVCTGFIHESFTKNNATIFTRPWFAWANSQFADVILKVADERPHLIFKQ